MKFELVEPNQHLSLSCLAASSDMEHYAKNKLGREPKIGEDFSLTMSGPRQKDGLAATQDDYEKYGTWEATGVFRRIA